MPQHNDHPTFPVNPKPQSGKTRNYKLDRYYLEINREYLLEKQKSLSSLSNEQLFFSNKELVRRVKKDILKFLTTDYNSNINVNEICNSDKGSFLSKLNAACRVLPRSELRRKLFSLRFELMFQKSLRYWPCFNVDELLNGSKLSSDPIVSQLNLMNSYCEKMPRSYNRENLKFLIYDLKCDYYSYKSAVVREPANARDLLKYFQATAELRLEKEYILLRTHDGLWKQIIAAIFTLGIYPLVQVKRTGFFMPTKQQVTAEALLKEINALSTGAELSSTFCIAK